MSENSTNNQDKMDAFLPPVELIQKYEELGIGKDLISIVKDEQIHRHGIQKKYLTCYIFGQISSLILAAIVFLGIYKFMLNGLIIQAYIVLGVYAILFIFAFIKARRDRVRNITNNSKKRILSNSNTRPQPKRYNTSYSSHNNSHSSYNSYNK